MAGWRDNLPELFQESLDAELFIGGVGKLRQPSV